jgi:hypothetical protein
MGVDLNPPSIEFIAARRVRLIEDWRISETLSIPTGFESDLGSIPRIFWWFLKPEQVQYASIIHDFEWLLGDFGKFSYYESNKTFYQNSVYLDRIPKYKAKICFVCLELVRIFIKKND